MSAVELGFLFHVGNLGAAFAKSNQKLLADIGMGHLTTAEAHSDLDTVAILQEFHRTAHFGVQVVGVDARRHTDLFDLNDVLIFPGFLFFLELVEAEFAVVHDLADRRNGIGRDLDQVKLLLLGHFQGSLGRDDSDHRAVGSDEADFLIPNVFIELMI